MRILGAVLAAFAFNHACLGAVQINVTGPGGSVTTPVEDPPGSKQWIFSVRAEPVSGHTGTTTFDVTTSDPEDVLKLVTVEARAQSSVLRLNLGLGLTQSVGSIGEVKIGPDPLDDNGRFFLQVFSTGNVTRLEANRLLSSRIGGELYDGAVMKPYMPPNLPDSFVPLPGWIETLRVDGSITGTVWAQSYLPGTLAEQYGTIERLQASAILTKSEGPFPVGVYAAQRIGSITAGSMVDTVIAARPRAAPFNELTQYVVKIGRVEVGESVSGSGDFKGELLAVRLGDGATENPGIFCTGIFEGTIAVGEEFVSIANPQLTPEMQFGTGGIWGMIHIGTKRVASDINTPTPWTAPVKIGPIGPDQIALTGTSIYSPDSIGGGLVGRKPFNVIKSKCVPAQFSTVPPRDVEVLWQFTGPVQNRVSLNNPALLLLRLESPSQPMSACFQSAGYQYNLDAGTVRVIPPYLPPGSYFVDLAFSDTGGVGELGAITPYTPGGLSFIVSAPFGQEAGNVSPFEGGQFGSFFTQRFTIVDSCPGDFNNDGQRNTADLVLILGKFGTTQPCSAPEDIVVNFAVNTADLTAFLGVLGTPCSSGRPGDPGTGSASAPTDGTALARDGVTAGQGTRPGSGETGTATSHQTAAPEAPAALPPVLAALGFTTIEGYTTWVNARTPAELNAHIVELLETIQQLEATP
ncbi:MAG: hypothetical protein ACKVZJ_00185 [Phycisphaerales bacterium]